jgi:hypothetical protein
MEGKRKTPERCVRRYSEGHRLEDQLLVTAYEQIRPVVLKRRGQPAAKRSKLAYETTARTQQARSA